MLLVIEPRAVRRHHRERLKVKRAVYWGFLRQEGRYRGVMTERHLGIVVKTPHPCSCYGCGNPRRIGELTMQERKFSCE